MLALVSTTIERHALIARIVDPSFRIVKLIAPAGFGKTTVVMSAFAGRPAFARVDCEGAATTIAVMKRIVLATADFQSPAARNDLSQAMLGLGDDADGWIELADSFLQNVPPAFVLHLENAEALHRMSDAQLAIEGLVTRLRDDARAIVCSRVDVLPFASERRQQRLHAPDLKMTPIEISAALERLSLSSAELDAVERFTDGWPIVVMMLVALARRGQLHRCLNEKHDITDLYGYLASEVFEYLSAPLARVLEALTAIPDISEAELAMLFPDEDVTGIVQSLRTETPFMAATRSRLEVHPALREMIAEQTDLDEYRARLYAAVDRADGGIRAAEIALLRDRADDAGRVLNESGIQGDFWTPSHAEVFTRLPESVFVDYPGLWIGAMFPRASHDVVAALHTTRRLLLQISDQTPPQTRIDLTCAVAQLFANRGQLDDAQKAVDALVTDPALEGNAMAQIVRGFFSAVIAGYRGDPIDVPTFRQDFGAVLESAPMQHSFCEVIIFAPYYRTQGERHAEEAALQRGLDLAAGAANSIAIPIANVYAAMSAWFWGDLERFEIYVNEVEQKTLPSFRYTFSHFIACARGRGSTAKHLTEKLDMRTYGYAIAATLAKSPRERLELAEAALTAAQQSSQRLCEVIARVILAYCQTHLRDLHLSRAQVLAGEMGSPVMVAALEALLAGSADGTMFESLVNRLPAPARRESSVTPLYLTSGGEVRFGTLHARLSSREFELLDYLASRTARAEARSVVTAIWPNVSYAKATLNLRATTRRLRQRVGDRRVVTVTPNGYALGLPVIRAD